jgi:hypothetical protein
MLGFSTSELYWSQTFLSATSDPIGLYGKLNCGVLLAITPEYKTIKAAQPTRRRPDPETGRQHSP